MLNFKTFKFVYSLNEELTPSQKKQVDKWPRDPAAVAATDHYFGKGNDVKTQPLEKTQDKSEVHKAVERHLGHEIHPDDYREGHTTDKYGRKVKIGGLLAKSKAPKEIVNGFANDSTRQGKKFTGLSVKISRHPHDVAGQTSRGQSWEEQSCKNYETGCNRHYLPNEVKHGTVVGYLRDHEGKEIARATLQPHHNDAGNVAYAVDSHYGINHDGFEKHMEHVAKQLSGEHKGGSLAYHKHPEVYDDNGYSIAAHPDATPENIDQALNDEREHVRVSAAGHPNASEGNLDRAIKDKSSFVRAAAASNTNATEKHLDRAIKDKSYGVRGSAARNPKATEGHLDTAMNDKNSNVRMAAANHSNANEKHLDQALRDKDSYIRATAAGNKNATEKHLDNALNDDDEHVRAVAAKNPKATPKVLDKALADKSHFVRSRAITNPNVNAGHLDQALRDKEQTVRSEAAANPNANEKHLDKAIKDRATIVRMAAAKHSNANAGHLDQALRDKDWGVRYNAIQNPNANAEHVRKAFNDPYYAVRAAAANHRLANKEDLEKASFDEDRRVRDAAKSNLGLPTQHSGPATRQSSST